MGWLIWHLVGREVKVLATTAQAVARRTPESLEPIESEAVPEEVQPLVDALNGLMGGSAERSRSSASSSPMPRTSCVRRSRRCACSCSSPSGRATRQSAPRPTRCCTRASCAPTHVVEQLLTLARADPEAPRRHATEVDLAELAHGVVLSHEAEAGGERASPLAKASRSLS